MVSLLITGDEAFRIALMYYNSVRNAARRRVAGAETAQHEIERDLKALLKGTRDGEITIRKRKPVLTGGISEVIDETRSNRTHDAFKATVEGKE